MEVKQKVLLIILDGLGSAPKSEGNAVVLADPQNLSTLWNTSPHTYLLASGEAVGLPKDIQGNSEVGHLNIGAGRSIYQNLPRINKAIEQGTFLRNTTLLESVNHAKKHTSNIHIIGLLSDGGVHGDIKHIIATLDFISRQNFEGEVYIHTMTDGRDTPPKSASVYFEMLNTATQSLNTGKIATVCGRNWAMDRSEHWERTEKAYNLLARNIGSKYNSYQEVLADSYNKGVTDEFIEPSVIVPNSYIKNSDTVLFLNFRPDRAMQLSQAISLDTFEYFPRVKLKNLFFASMVEYRKKFPKNVIFTKQYINLPLGKVISSVGLRQLRIAEDEKFPHVTYFFNGGVSVRFSGEDRIQVPSPIVPTYDLKPEMSAREVTDILLSRISTSMYDFTLVNFANPDMVAHTGDISATKKAVQTVDQCTHDLVKAFVGTGGVVIITADHGNAEELINLQTGEVDTEHSVNPVPFMVVGANMPARQLPYGSLKDISPTVLDLMGIPKPTEMTGRSLLTS